MSTAPHSRHQGFTLIELLTVIAIIAILMAILFPVFATVRENARQGTVLSNLHQISTALGQFQLDNRKYPDVLFGYVYLDPSTGKPVPMDKALGQAQSDYANGTGLANSNPTLYFPGLYPEYVKDVNVFNDPNNPVTDFSKDYAAQVNLLAPCDAARDAACSGATDGALVPAVRDFYMADAYDLSPRITGNNTYDTNPPPGSNSKYLLVPRYQTSWTSIVDTYNCTTASSTAGAAGLCARDTDNVPRNDYVRQLRWKNPPADTYVTCSTYHVQNANKVIVLWESGAAKKLDTSKFLATGDGGAQQPDATTVAVSNGVSQANFWKTSLNK